VFATGCTTEQLSTGDHAIIGGERSQGNAATIMLVGWPSDRTIIHTCTAVLISPTVALTAAHCIDAATHPNYSYGIFPGDDASAYPFLVDLEPHLLPVTSVHPHPQYSPDLPFYGDIGTIVLQDPLPVVPLSIRRAPIDQGVIGMPALIIGYGQTTYLQNNAARYEAMTTVTAIENDTIVVGDSARRSCLGDSGGPAIMQNVVVGIDSYGPTGCGGPAHYRRVDSFLPFVDQYVPPPPVGGDAGPQPGSDAGTDPGDEGGCAVGADAGLGLALALAGLRRRRTATR
jgi:V8-like Glu-specific endopeptidase